MLKQIQFHGRDEDGNVQCQPLWGEDPISGLEKTAEWKPSHLHPAVKEFVKGIKPTPKGVYILVNALGAGEYWGSNVNGDLFPEKALIHAPPDWESFSPEKMKEVGKTWKYGFPSFMNAYPYKHHVNKDPSRAFGEVKLAVWNPKMHRVELVVYLDRALCEKWAAGDVIERIDRGEYPDVSMGCKVPFDICMICGHKSKTRKDYCEHARDMMNKILPDGRKVAVRNDSPRFFDISFVFIGADKSAKMLAKLAMVGDMQCMGGFCTIPHASAEVAEKFASVDARAQEMADDWALQKVASQKIELEVDDSESSFVRMLSHIKRVAGGGHSFEVVVDPGEDDEKSFGVDGDGNQHIRSIKVDGKDYKEKIAQKAIKRQVTFEGRKIKVEVDPGDVRKGTDAKGKKWERVMKASYGYIPNTKGKDGETVDVYLAEKPKPGGKVQVIKQVKKDGSYDEDKVMIGYRNKASAKASYMKHVPASCFGSITELSQAEFSSFLRGHEKTASGGFDVLAEAFGQKSASHRKLSEIIKDVPAGPFRKATMPKLEKAEGKLPKSVLSSMSKCAFEDALSTSGYMGIILKPQEFQRIVLTKIGEEKLADSLEDSGLVFPPTQQVDNDVEVCFNCRNDELQQELMPYMAGRSIATPLLEKRAAFVDHHPVKMVVTTPVTGDILLTKVSAMYNGYRASLVKEADVIEQVLASDPQLLPTVSGGSMVEAFTGGIGKTASASVLGPRSLAYLHGAHMMGVD